MKTFLLTAAFILTCAVSTQANDDALNAIPKQFHGIWCGADKGYVRPQRKTCPDSSGDYIMVVTAKGYSIEERTCKAAKTVTYADPRRLWVRFVCTNPGGDEEDYRISWTLIARKLVVRSP